jgi:hypothetical protein
VFELTVGGRGIRSLEYSQQQGRYLIVAGPFNSKGAFTLYSWSAKPQEDAVPIPVFYGRKQCFSTQVRPRLCSFSVTTAKTKLLVVTAKTHLWGRSAPGAFL